MKRAYLETPEDLEARVEKIVAEYRSNLLIQESPVIEEGVPRPVNCSVCGGYWDHYTDSFGHKCLNDADKAREFLRSMGWTAMMQDDVIGCMVAFLHDQKDSVPKLPCPCNGTGQANWQCCYCHELIELEDGCFVLQYEGKTSATCVSCWVDMSSNNDKEKTMTTQEMTIEEAMRELQIVRKLMGPSKAQTAIGILLSGSNYTADDATFPTEVTFANGRRVGIAFDGDKPYLTVSNI